MCQWAIWLWVSILFFSLMSTPLLGLILGMAVLCYAILGYKGSSSLSPLPNFLKHKGNLLWAIGNIAIAIALMLGFVGYLGFLHASYLRLFRIVLGSFGLLMLSCRLFKIRHLIKEFYQNFSKHFQVQTRSTLLQTKRYWELLSVLVPQNLHTRYRGSFLGVYWSLLNPLLMMGIYTAIFGTAFSSYYDNSILNYVLAAFTGLAITNFYTASTSQALASVVTNGGLLNKIRLPVGIFPVSMIAANLFQFAFGVFPLLAIMTLVITQDLVHLLALSFPIVSLTLVCMGVGYFMSALFVFFRDLGYFYELVCFVLWISSPVFYPSDIIPEAVKPFISLNPLVPIIENLREIALSDTLPDPMSLGGSLLGSLIVLALGWAFFQWLRPQFMDLL
jgi:lipopolysaccharide transport system permease protein